MFKTTNSLYSRVIENIFHEWIWSVRAPCIWVIGYIFSSKITVRRILSFVIILNAWNVVWNVCCLWRGNEWSASGGGKGRGATWWLRFQWIVGLLALDQGLRMGGSARLGLLTCRHELKLTDIFFSKLNILIYFVLIYTFLLKIKNLQS
jgi:hypothetical protein